MIEFAYVAFGSNSGNVDPRAVVIALSNRKIRVLRTANIYESRPAEGVAGGNFTNTVFECEKSGSVRDFLKLLQDTENEMGSKVRKNMEARTCDLDLLLWGEDVFDMPDLKVPHPRLHRRDFVLAPLCDLIPDEALPLSGKTPRRLLMELTVRSLIGKLPE
ncbi:2-amino-4-hydroxy-6-hydroxymethyldihydropteridine diphosphokinase [bacterium]|nr:2-amino-4-hydroxy-6-hydroxymethyldihydropteridine diphosphokinase [bacterium]